MVSDFYPMKRFLVIFLLLGSALNSYSQNRNNIWCFGDSAGIDFNQTPPLPTVTSLDTRGSCVSISDSSGNLLFYANTRATFGFNTTKIWDKSNLLMQNGDSIIGQGWYNELSIIPKPGNQFQYYLFTLNVASRYGFYYSVIDMSLNGGFGAVTQKNIQLNTYKAWDAMATVKHGNGRDWWIITKDYDSGNAQDSLHVYLVDPFGIHESIQRIGAAVSGGSGKMTFSKNGSKFLFTEYNGLIETIDFDRCTGLFSNAQIIYNPSVNGPSITGSALSPNGNVAYFSNADATTELIQLDLIAPNIWASRDTIVQLTHPFETGGSLRLGPDNKIYWSCAWTNLINFNYPYQDTMYHTENMNLSVINNPDVVGSGCNFSLYSFNLGGKRCYWGLPNNPDYDLGHVVGSVCDSLSSAVNEIKFENVFDLFPNPACDHFTLSLTAPLNSGSLIVITDQLGKIIRRVNININSTSYEINTADIMQGIYFVSIQNGQRTLGTQKIVIIR